MRSEDSERKRSRRAASGASVSCAPSSRRADTTRCAFEIKDASSHCRHGCCWAMAAAERCHGGQLAGDAAGFCSALLARSCSARSSPSCGRRSCRAAAVSAWDSDSAWPSTGSSICSSPPRAHLTLPPSARRRVRDSKSTAPPAFSVECHCSSV